MPAFVPSPAQRAAFAKQKQTEVSAQQQVLSALRGGRGVQLQPANPIEAFFRPGVTPPRAYAAELNGEEVLKVPGGYGLAPGTVNVGGRTWSLVGGPRGHDPIYRPETAAGPFGSVFKTPPSPPPSTTPPGGPPPGPAPATSPNTITQRSDDLYNQLRAQHALTEQGQFQRYFQTGEMNPYFGAVAPGGPANAAAMAELARQKVAPGTTPGALSNYYRAESAMGRANMSDVVAGLTQGKSAQEAQNLTTWAKANPMLAFREYNKTRGQMPQLSNENALLAQTTGYAQPNQLQSTPSLAGIQFPSQSTESLMNTAAAYGGKQVPFVEGTAGMFHGFGGVTPSSSPQGQTFDASKAFSPEFSVGQSFAPGALVQNPQISSEAVDAQRAFTTGSGAPDFGARDRALDFVANMKRPSFVQR